MEVAGLVKRYPKAPVNAVDGISFTVAAGEVFGLLGPNGAGKTTTVGMLTTRVRPTAGDARVGGVDVFADPVGARARLAVVPQRSNLDRSLSIRNNLIFHAAYHGVARAQAAARADRLLSQFGLSERGDVKPDMFSGGQSQRVMIARALMHRPQVLFLDEPSTGLDPAARLFVWDRLRELTAQGVTLILTTHDMHEAAELADRVAIMDHGRVLALDTPAGLMSALPGSSTLELSARAQERDGDGAETRRAAPIRDGDGAETSTAATPGAGPPARRALLAALGALPGVERVEPIEPPGAEGEGVRVRVYVEGQAPRLIAPAVALLAEHRMTLTGVEIGKPTLEDVFIHLTGRTLR